MSTTTNVTLYARKKKSGNLIKIGIYHLKNLTSSGNNQENVMMSIDTFLRSFKTNSEIHIEFYNALWATRKLNKEVVIWINHTIEV